MNNSIDSRIVPCDSFLHHWIYTWSNTETPVSWRIATGLAIVGVVLRRNAYFYQGEAAPIWPNLSIMLVGPPGLGKDTLINPSAKVMDSAGGEYVVGKTIEAVKMSLYHAGNPAVGYILAPELAEFLGGKDYQSGIMEGLTDLLTGKEKADITLKADITRGEKKFIYNSTLTMFAGSNKDWLQNNLPKGSLDGGFLPRFVILPETRGNRFVANPGKYDSIAERNAVLAAKQEFLRKVVQTEEQYRSAGLTGITETNGYDNAQGYYTNWYENRYKKFSPICQAYAPRSAGLMRRLAMLMAITRDHNYIEEADYIFASELILYTADRLETAVIPASPEVVAGNAVLELLPATQAVLLRQLAIKYGMLWVKRGISYLIESDQVVQGKDGMFIKRKGSTESLDGSNTTT